MMKLFKITFLTLSLILLVGCQPPDDGVVLSDTFLEGDWIRSGFCEDQNIWTFRANETYTLTHSFNTDCDNNEVYTIRATGTYDFTGDLIILYQEDIEVIDLGTNNEAPDIILTTEEVYEFQQLNNFTFSSKLISRNGMTIQGTPTDIYVK